MHPSTAILNLPPSRLDADSTPIRRRILMSPKSEHDESLTYFVLAKVNPHLILCGRRWILASFCTGLCESWTNVFYIQVNKRRVKLFSRVKHRRTSLTPEFKIFINRLAQSWSACALKVNRRAVLKSYPRCGCEPATINLDANGCDKHVCTTSPCAFVSRVYCDHIYLCNLEISTSSYFISQ